VDSWLILGLVILFWPVIAAAVVITGLLLWFMWMAAIAFIKDAWGHFFGH